MKQKLAATLLAAAMVSTLLSGCGNAAADGPATESAASADAQSTGTADTADSAATEGSKPYEGVTLTVWAGSQEYNTGWQMVMEKATEELGMEFEVEINPAGTEGDNIIKTRCASGDLPDISNYNSGSLLAALNPSEHFLDLTDYEVTQKFDDTFKSCVSEDGRVYGAPFYTTQAGACVYYKPDYEELGLEVPKTWDEFLANCDALEAAGKTAVYLSAHDTWTTQVLFLGDNYNVISAEPDFAENFTAGTAKFASTPVAVEGWEKYEDLVGRYNADASAATYEDGVEAIATGAATHWFILTQTVPAMIDAHPEANDKIGVFGVPGSDAGDNGLTVWEPNALYINKDSANIDACIAFLEFMYEEENLDLYINNYGANGPSCIKGYELPDSVAPAIRVDMQAYFDAGKTVPALEFMTSVKGATCEQITTSVATGQISGAEAAEMYDEDCKKSAVQQGLNW